MYRVFKKNGGWSAVLFMRRQIFYIDTWTTRCYLDYRTTECYHIIGMYSIYPGRKEGHYDTAGF